LFLFLILTTQDRSLYEDLRLHTVYNDHGVYIRFPRARGELFGMRWSGFSVKPCLGKTHLSDVSWKSPWRLIIDTLLTCRSLGLPKEFEKYFKGLIHNRYFLRNVAGHDCFSHFGNWIFQGDSGWLDSAGNFVLETDDLRTFVAETKEKVERDKPEIVLSVGPAPGSFWADNRKSRGCWSNLPRSLEEALQRLSQTKPYGSILNVAINADGGWVIQLKPKLLSSKGEPTYEFGGDLPYELKKTLEDGKQSKKPKHIQVSNLVSGAILMRGSRLTRTL
jgi:hypothetical protein